MKSPASLWIARKKSSCRREENHILQQHSRRGDRQTCKHVNTRFLDLKGESPVIREAFLDFLHLNRTTSDRMAKAILTLVATNGINVKGIIGRALDGGGAISSDVVKPANTPDCLAHADEGFFHNIRIHQGAAHHGLCVPSHQLRARGLSFSAL